MGGRRSTVRLNLKSLRSSPPGSIERSFIFKAMVGYKLYDDPFTAWMEARGMAVGIYQPGGFMGRPPVGRKVTVGKSTIVYRIIEEAAEDLIVVLLERQGRRSGLKSSFADFARFIALVKKSGAPIKSIRGHVGVLGNLPEDHVSIERIAAFYKRYLAAHQVFIENGVEWVSGDLTKHIPPLRSGLSVLNEDEGRGSPTAVGPGC